ncbi:MAG: WS/DGAT domain-containing protein, partial [Halioglobus sp.]|nr:WS/DGAT domain-containing protein [Halioglobus sp.]
LAGARVHMMMGMGPLLDMMGLFHAVISGVGRITINFTSCREMLPDPEFYRQCLTEAYEQLHRATVRKSRAKATRGRGKKASGTAAAKAKSGRGKRRAKAKTGSNAA